MHQHDQGQARQYYQPALLLMRGGKNRPASGLHVAAFY